MQITVGSITSRSSAMTEALVVGLLVLISLTYTISHVPILNGDEARFAQASREMYFNGERVVPTFGGQPRYDKPILVYWATCASFQIFGISPFAARFPSALAAALCACLLAWSARKRWGPGSGIAAGLLIASSPIFFFEGRTCTADALNMLWTLASMLALEQLLSCRPTRRASAVFWISTGAAVLTKGPVAPLFICSTLIGIWALSRRWKVWDSVIGAVLCTAGAIWFGPVVLTIPAFAAAAAALSSTDHRRRAGAFRWLWGVPLFLLITLPWAIQAWKATSGDYFAVAVGRHVLERGQSALEGHSGFPGFYLITAVVICFPWFACSLSAGRDAWRHRRESSTSLFLLAWAIGPLVTLEIVQTKLVHYWMPSYPALILLAVGFLWTTGARQTSPRERSSLPAAVHIVGVTVLAAIPLIPVFAFDLSGLLLQALVLSSLLLVITAIGVSLSVRRPKTSILVASCGSLLFLVILFAPFLSKISQSFIGTRATAMALDHVDQGRTVAMYGLRDEEMLFSLPVDTVVCRSVEEVQAAVRRDRNSIFYAREKDFLRGINSQKPDRFMVVDTIEGLDLGRGRHTTGVFFKLARSVQRDARRSAREKGTFEEHVEVEEGR